MIERALKSAARIAFAYNQSPAKRVLDPVYDVLAKRLLAGVPASKRLAATRYSEDLFPAYRAQSRKLAWYVEDLDFSEAKPELLTARQRAMIHTVALG